MKNNLPVAFLHIRLGGPGVYAGRALRNIRHSGREPDGLRIIVACHFSLRIRRK